MTQEPLMFGYKILKIKSGKLWSSVYAYEWQPRINGPTKKPSFSNNYGFHAWKEPPTDFIISYPGQVNDEIIVRVVLGGTVLEFEDTWRGQYAAIDSIDAAAGPEIARYYGAALVSLTRKLSDVLAAHQLWLDGKPEGIKAVLRDFNLSQADLQEANLQEADLFRSHMLGTNLQGADLRGARLSATTLQEANLSKADLTGADLETADLRGAILIEANLTEANLTRADLRDADLERADLRDANLIAAKLLGTNLTGANLLGTIVILPPGSSARKV